MRTTKKFETHLLLNSNFENYDINLEKYFKRKKCSKKVLALRNGAMQRLLKPPQRFITVLLEGLDRGEVLVPLEHRGGGEVAVHRLGKKETFFRKKNLEFFFSVLSNHFFYYKKKLEIILFENNIL